MSGLKNPVKVRAGAIGAKKRWGEPRIARLDSLDPRVREAVIALIRADEAARAREQSNEKAPAVDDPSAEAPEVRRVRDERPAA